MLKRRRTLVGLALVGYCYPLIGYYAIFRTFFLSAANGGQLLDEVKWLLSVEAPQLLIMSLMCALLSQRLLLAHAAAVSIVSQCWLYIIQHSSSYPAHDPVWSESELGYWTLGSAMRLFLVLIILETAWLLARARRGYSALQEIIRRRKEDPFR